MTRQQLEHTPGVDKVLSFGKFKGKTILQVIDEKPAYIVWCIRNVVGFFIDPTLSKELCKQFDEYFRRYNLTQANGYTSTEVKRLMEKPYCMHATEAMGYLEYDVPEYH
jgi:hypothetical protein